MIILLVKEKTFEIMSLNFHCLINLTNLNNLKVFLNLVMKMKVIL